MAQTSLLLTARSIGSLVQSLNAFLAAQPNTLLVRNLTFTVQDLEQYDGVEIRCLLQYDPTGGTDYGSAFVVEQYSASRLPILQQDLNTAIAAAEAELWYTLPLITIETEARLPQYTALVLRHADANAAENISYFSPGGGPVPPPSPYEETVVLVGPGDSPYSAAVDMLVVANVTDDPIEVILPDAEASEGLRVRVMRQSQNASVVHPVEVAASGTDMINDNPDANPLVMEGDDDCYTFLSGGTSSWWIVGQVLGPQLPYHNP